MNMTYILWTGSTLQQGQTLFFEHDQKTIIYMVQILDRAVY